MDSPTLTPGASSASYDLVIKNGRVLDGAGNPWVNADIAIKDGKIAKIGLVTRSSSEVIDAAGMYVSPGWIDAMDQSGWVLQQSGTAENKLLMGVTTAVGGEGGTPVPAAEIADYFDLLESQGISINFATFYNATQSRVEVIGDVSRAPTQEELTEMKHNVDVAMRAGAIGVSTALIYPPSTFQTTEELIEIVSAAAPYDAIYATHMRDEGKNLIPAIQEAIAIGEGAGVKVEIFHLKAAYKPGWGNLMKLAGEEIDAARERGVDIAADMYPYVAGGSGLEILLPPDVFADGAETAIKNLRDRDYRQNLVNDIASGRYAEWESLNFVTATGGWEGIVLANAHNPKYDQYRFENIQTIADRLERDPYELVIDIMIEALPERAVALYFLMSEEDVQTGLQFPWVSIGSDAAASRRIGEVDDLALPHPRAYGTFPRIISRYVRDTKTLTLEDAIRKMTSWPATRYGFYDRGLIREGLWADLVIFDYETLTDEASWDNATAPATGIQHVIVNGVPTISNGTYTGAIAGRVLRGPGATVKLEQVK